MVVILKPASITMGDPAGIGPEIIVKALSRLESNDRYIVFGCPRVIQRAIQTSSVEMVVNKITNIEEATFKPNVIEVLETSSFKELPIFGKHLKIMVRVHSKRLLPVLNMHLMER